MIYGLSLVCLGMCLCHDIWIIIGVIGFVSVP